MTLVSEAHDFLAAETEMAAGIPGIQLSVRAVRGRFASGPFCGFHDQVQLPGGRWGLAVGEALALRPGANGVSPAGGVGTAKAVLRAMAMTDLAPSAVLTGMNRALLAWSRDEGGCVAVAYADVEPAWRGVRVRVCVAGAPTAFVRRARGPVCSVGAPGYCLGARADARLADAQVSLHAGDALVLVAATVTAAVGADRISEVLATSGEGSAARTTDAVLAAVRTAGGGQVRHEAVVLALKVPLRKRNAGTHAAGWPGRARYSDA